MRLDTLQSFPLPFLQLPVSGLVLLGEVKGKGYTKRPGWVTLPEGLDHRISPGPGGGHHAGVEKHAGLQVILLQDARFPFKAWSFSLRPPRRAGPKVQPEVAGPTWRRPQHGVLRTDSGQAGLALTQEPSKANRHRQSQSPTQGRDGLEDGHRLCSHLETPFIWLNKGGFRITWQLGPTC